MSRLDLGFPLSLDGRGRLASPAYDEHVRDLIEQLLFTLPGERVNRPDFGTVLRKLVFGGAGVEDLGAARYDIHAKLTRYLSELADFQRVEVEQAEDGVVTVGITYLVRETGNVRTDWFGP